MTIAYSRPVVHPAIPKGIMSGDSAVRRYMLTSRPRHRIRVSILDDHPIIALGMASFLQHQTDFEIVHTETSAVRFLESLKELPCDVAIVDFYLPRQPWDGVNFLKRLRRLHPDLIVITFSGGKISDTEYAAFKAGANGYVPKGERLPFLADMIRPTPNLKFFAISPWDCRSPKSRRSFCAARRPSARISAVQ
jgi:two-component system capsular synthesis response regulator RcsB